MKLVLKIKFFGSFHVFPPTLVFSPATISKGAKANVKEGEDFSPSPFAFAVEWKASV